MDHVDVAGDAGASRRRFLVRCVVGVQAAIASTLTVILGNSILWPSFRRATTSWLRAASLDDVPEGEPLAVTLRMARQDGVAQVVDRPSVYLVRAGAQQVRALHATCTHLGCRTSFDRKTKRILCPCHGGVYSVQGQVLDGPPPAPLRALPTRIEDGQILVAL